MLTLPRLRCPIDTSLEGLCAQFCVIHGLSCQGKPGHDLMPYGAMPHTCTMCMQAAFNAVWNSGADDNPCGTSCPHHAFHCTRPKYHAGRCECPYCAEHAHIWCLKLEERVRRARERRTPLPVGGRYMALITKRLQLLACPNGGNIVRTGAQPTLQLCLEHCTYCAKESCVYRLDHRFYGVPHECRNCAFRLEEVNRHDSDRVSDPESEHETPVPDAWQPSWNPCPRGKWKRGTRRDPSGTISWCTYYSRSNHLDCGWHKPEDPHRFKTNGL